MTNSKENLLYKPLSLGLWGVYGMMAQASYLACLKRPVRSSPFGYVAWAVTFIGVGLTMENFMKKYNDSLEAEKDRLVLRRTLRLAKEAESSSSLEHHS